MNDEQGIAFSIGDFNAIESKTYFVDFSFASREWSVREESTL